MSHSAGWPIATSGYDSLRIMTRRVDRQARAASPTSAADLLGPAMSSQAVHILDWNDEIATFNGWVYTTEGGLNSPVVQDDEGEDIVGLPFIGTIISREDGTGTQQAWNTDDPGSMYFRVRNWAPNPDDPTAPPIFGDWQRFATRSGFIAEEDLHPDVRDDIDQALEDAANGLHLAESVNKAYVEPVEPTDPDDDGRALVVNDTWFDSDDTNRPYRWDGSDWVDATTSWLVTNPTTTFPNVVISPDGVVAYNGAGVAVTTIDSATGFLTTLGSIFSSADISGSTVTGGVVQTDATPDRGVKMNSLGFVAYDGAGDPTFVIDASTGTITMKGSLTAGSFIYGARVRAGSVQLAALESVGGVGRLAFYDSTDTTYQGGVSYGFNTSMLDDGVSLVGPSGFTGAQVGVVGNDVVVDPISGGTFYVFGPERVNGDLHVQGNVTVSGSFPSAGSSWVGTATTALDMAAHAINNATGVNATGAVHGATIFADSVPTTGAAINGVMGGSGQFLMNTSARRYKYDDQLFEVDLAVVQELAHKRFRRYDDEHFDPDNPHAGRWYYGVIANEAEALNLTAWCTYDADDELQAFDYPGFATAVALAVTRAVAALTTRIENLEAA